ncbi:MAG: glycosyltransferase family 2 protein [Gelidibacter sp.]|nr:glycosyltransferase family 2 protein [Gelidibacter sp.]
MKNNNKLISVLITHFNRAHDLFKCIEAIHNLGFSNYEVVVSDDGSDNDTIALIKTYKFDQLVLSERNKGLAANINKGLKACKGNYILYCQEDFKLHHEIKNILPECIKLLDSNETDLIRFTSNLKFNKLNSLSSNIKSIPRFSFKNFLQNYYRYSDHPFITTNQFHNKFGYYMENTSGRYGETEYGIRISNSKANIAITNKTFANIIDGSESILINEFKPKKYKIIFSKSIIKIVRAFRLYFEWVFYMKNRRGLITYKNARKLTRN